MIIQMKFCAIFCDILLLLCFFYGFFIRNSMQSAIYLVSAVLISIVFFFVIKELSVDEIEINEYGVLLIQRKDVVKRFGWDDIKDIKNGRQFGTNCIRINGGEIWFYSSKKNKNVSTEKLWQKRNLWFNY